MSARAERPLRGSRLLDDPALGGQLDPDCRRACVAVVLPAGTRRRASELPTSRLLIVEDGLVAVRSPGGAGRRAIIVARCGVGAVLPPPTDGEALQSLTDAWLTAVPQGVWSRLLASPAVAERLLEGLEETSRRQREATRSLQGIRHVDRVRDQLIELAREHGRVCRDGVRIDLPLTHDLIADMVGCARETVTRALDELQRQAFVARRGRFYQLLVEPASLIA